MESQNEQVPGGVVELPGAGVPADQGVSSLGLLMQLAGSVFAALTTIITFFMLFAMRATMPGSVDRNDAMWVFIILGLCVARSMFHRMAGAELLYGRRTGFESTPESPLTGLRRYILVGLVQSALVAIIYKMKFHGDAKHVLATAAGLAAWPAALLALLATGRFRRLQSEVPVSEDKGFEGAAILMTVLGLCGVLGMGTILVLFLNEGGKTLSQGPGVLMLLAMVLLFIRSCLHLQAGMSGLRETSLDRAVELANRYANFGVVSAFCTGGAMLLIIMTESLNLIGLVMVTGVCWLLMAWPMIIRRFFSDRQFADLLAGDNANVHRRSPDAGLTGLGWLLVGHALFCASTLIPRLVNGDEMATNALQRLLMGLGGLPIGLRSPWWTAGVVVFELWAGIELVKMTKHSRYIASAFAVVATLVGLYVCWPIIEEFKGIKAAFGTQETLVLFGPIAIQFVIPVATLLLVNRQIAPTARARFRSRAV